MKSSHLIVMVIVICSILYMKCITMNRQYVIIQFIIFAYSLFFIGHAVKNTVSFFIFIISLISFILVLFCLC